MQLYLRKKIAFLAVFGMTFFNFSYAEQENGLDSEPAVNLKQASLEQSEVNLETIYQPKTAGCHKAKKKKVKKGLWPSLDANLFNTRVAPFEYKIKRSNVTDLTKVWEIDLPGISVAAQPTTLDGEVIYSADSVGNVYAINGNTGAIIWKVNLTDQSFDATPTIDGNSLYIADTYIFRLNRHNGSIIWATPVFPPGQFALDSAANVVVARDLAIVGVNSDEEFVLPPYHARGRVMAFNKHNGSIVWQFFVTSDQFAPNPQFGPGATIYSSAAVDLKRNLVFIGTGNNYLPPISPFSDSLIALDFNTGQLVWHYQFTNDDSFTLTLPQHGHDWDVGAHPNLFSVYTCGGKLDLVGVGDKGGRYLIFTREQPDPNNVQPLVYLFLDPGSIVGAIQSTGAVHDGVLYLASQAYQDPAGNRLSLNVITDPSDLSHTALNAVIFSSLRTYAFDIKELIKAGNTHGAIPPKALIWENVTPGISNNNPLTYSNGILFQGSTSGYFRALDARNGKELWRTYPVPGVGPTNPLPCFTSGITVANGKLFAGFGLSEGPAIFPVGGVFSYRLSESSE